MKKTALLIMMVALPVLWGCRAQNRNNDMETTQNHPTNPLLCDVQTGVCETPGAAAEAPAASARAKLGDKPIRIVYFTDPICSSCWGIEPQLRRLKLEYGHCISIEYRMGGLLPDWSYNSGGISKPSDVAHHWDEVSPRYDMPIDGDVWLEDPLDSSYPPSIAFKAAQMQDEGLAIVFLRALREMLFLEKKNITRWEHVAAAARLSGLDAEQLRSDYEGEARQRFEADLALARQMGVRGFPSLFFIDAQNQVEFVYGTKPYPVFEGSLLKLYPEAEKTAYDTSWQGLFGHYPTLTVREFAVLAGVARAEAEALLESLTTAGTLHKITTKNGNLYKR